MRLGPKLVVFGAIIGSLSLTFSLYNLAAALPYNEFAKGDAITETNSNPQAIESKRLDPSGFSFHLRPGIDLGQENSKAYFLRHQVLLS